MARVQLEAIGLEFEEGGNTIWIHGPGGTVLRIKCSGRVRVSRCTAPTPHADVRVMGDITFCVPSDANGNDHGGDDEDDEEPVH